MTQEFPLIVIPYNEWQNVYKYYIIQYVHALIALLHIMSSSSKSSIDNKQHNTRGREKEGERGKTKRCKLHSIPSLPLVAAGQRRKLI